MKRLLSFLLALTMLFGATLNMAFAETVVLEELTVPMVEAAVETAPAEAIIEVNDITPVTDITEVPSLAVTEGAEEVAVEAAVETVTEEATIAVEEVPSDPILWFAGYYQIPAGTALYKNASLQDTYGVLAEQVVGYSDWTDAGIAFVIVNLDDTFVTVRIPENILTKVDDAAYLAGDSQAKVENGIRLFKAVLVAEPVVAEPVAVEPVKAAVPVEEVKPVAVQPEILPDADANAAEMMLTIALAAPVTAPIEEAKESEETYEIPAIEVEVPMGDLTVAEIMAEFEMDGTTLVRYKGSRTNLVIPNDSSLITAIGEFAFTECTTLTGVSIPDTITSIGTGAFHNCTSLLTVSLPSNLTAIPDQMFKGCVSLRTVSIPALVTKIGERAFESCTSLNPMVLPSNLQEIGKYAFFHDTALGDMGFPGSLKVIGDHAFEGCASLTNLNFSDGLLQIKDYAFADCTNVTSLYLPTTLTEIGSYAFYNDPGLQFIRIPVSVTKVRASAFDKIAANPTFLVFNPSMTIGNYALGNNGMVVGYNVSTAHNYTGSFTGNLFCAMETWNFVTNCYVNLMNRYATDQELINWCKPLAQQTLTGAELIAIMTESEEFTKRGLSVTDTVNQLFQAMLMRAADTDGMTFYVNCMNDMVSTRYITNMIASSKEFIDDCWNTYCVKPGSLQMLEYRDFDILVTRFVDRLYRLIMGREPDIDGLNNWCRILLNGEQMCAYVVNSFVMSPEFTARNLTYDEQVEVLYNTMLDRGSDPEGKKGWVTVLNLGCSIQYVTNGFSTSKEFRNICLASNLRPGNINLTQPRDQNAAVTAFVTRCYKVALNRVPDIDGLNGWCDAILKKKVTPQDVATRFVFSKEASNMNWDNEEFIDQLYNVFLDRASEPAGKAGWLLVLDQKVMTREKVADGFIKSNEFKAIVKSYGL